MPNQATHKASLPHPNGKHFPSLVLTIDARYQFAVTCGTESASAFFHQHPEITLHAHLPASLEYFLRQARVGAAALGVEWAGRDREITDAFLAGYMGRIQQELRIMRTPNPPEQRLPAAMH